jgi:hypothetical protein
MKYNLIAKYNSSLDGQLKNHCSEEYVLRENNYKYTYECKFCVLTLYT